jgi:hypothetical protein
MRVGPSEWFYRGRLQTSPSCPGLRPLAVSVNERERWNTGSVGNQADERKTRPSGYKRNDPGGYVIKFIALLSGAILLLPIGCSGEGPDQDTSLLPSHKASMPTVLRIIIKWPGDDFASKQDLETRSKIENLIVERGVGSILRDGTGMGWMDIFVGAEDRESAKKAIDKIMEEAAPKMKYLIE